MDYVIRRLEESDIRPGTGFFETLGNLTEVKAVSEEKVRELFQMHVSQQSVIYAAVSESLGIIGMITLLPEPKFFRGGTIAGHIEDVVTRKEYQTNGVASALIKKAIEAGKALGCYKIILDCEEWNMALYEKFGFFRKENQMRLNLS